MRSALLLAGLTVVLTIAASAVVVIYTLSSPNSPAPPDASVGPAPVAVPVTPTSPPPPASPLPPRADAASEDEGPRLADRPGFTVDFVLQALDRYDREGREVAVAYYNSPESAVGEWYVFIFDESDNLITHQAHELIGQDLKGSLGVDQASYRFGQAMLEATGEGLWVDYLFLNPRTGNQEYKHSWVIRHDGLLFGSGWYQVLPASPLTATKADPVGYTIALVDRAVRYYRAHGREGAIRYYSSPQSVDGLWSVFILDEEGKFIAHWDPSILGVHIDETGTPSDGRPFDSRQVTEAGLWIDYPFFNSVTGKEGVNHVWIVRHGGVFIGSGWYE